jgi:hypothetical protein
LRFLIRVTEGRVKQTQHWAVFRPSEFPEAQAGMSAEEQEQGCRLKIDRVRLPADEDTRI